jgi:hypothetical protein
VKGLKAGPELKMPDFKNLKVPEPLVDLYWDLRDRHLLPIVGLVLIAIVAVPSLLGGSKEGFRAPVVPSAGAPSPEPIAGASSSRLTVVQAQPGLRDYKKRLKDDSPTNPFKQRYTGPMLAGTKLGNGEEGGGSTTSTSTVTTTTGGGGESGSGSSGGGGGEGSPGGAPAGGGSGNSPGGESGGGSENGVPSGYTLYTLEVTVQVTRIETKPDGTVDKKGPTVYKDIQAPAPLPGEKTPVITYLGMGSKHHEPLFLVSNEVSAIYGEARCISGTTSCQLLALEEGFPVTFVYGENAVRYKINLLKVKPIVTGNS